MALIEVGQHAPSFRLPSGQGPERGLDDYRGRSHVILWFTKGMGCPFCRSQMSQLARGYERIRGLGADVLQVTPTPPSRAAFYVRNFNLPFVYLCDPDYSVHRQWGVDGRSHGPGWYAQRLYTAMKMTPPQSDLGDPRPTLGEMHSNLADTDMGLFLIDRAGVVRWVVTGAYGGPQGVRGIPSTEEIVRELERAAA
jgi:peroxiredoxin